MSTLPAGLTGSETHTGEQLVRAVDLAIAVAGKRPQTMVKSTGRLSISAQVNMSLMPGQKSFFESHVRSGGETAKYD